MKTDVIVTDMGTSLTCTHATLKVKKGQRVITSTGLGEMGFGLPGAIGCALANNISRVVLIVGEGSLMMNLQELQTMNNLKLPIKIILLNNNSYLTIEHTLKALYGSDQPQATNSNNGLTFPSFSKLCKVFGINYSQISSSKNLHSEIIKFLNVKGSAMIDVKMEEGQELIPKSAIKVNEDGTVFSPPLEDLYPFLPKEELEKEMIIPIIESK